MAEQELQERRLAGPVGTNDGDPFAGRDQQIDRAESEAGVLDNGAVQSGDDVAAACRGTDVEAQVPRHPRLLHDLEAGDRPLGASRSSGQLLRLADAVVTDELVALVGATHLGLPLRRPLAFALSSARQRRALRLVVGEPFPGVSFDRRLLVEVGLPAAVESSRPVGELVELDDARDRPSEERAVVADDHNAGVQGVDPALQAIEPIEIEVVGRLVEQVHIEARQQQGGESDPRAFPARQRGGRLVEQLRRQTEVVPHPGDASIEIGSAQRQPALQGDVVASGRPRVGALAGESVSGGVQLGGCRGDAGAPVEMVTNRLGAIATALLSQVADRRRWRRQLDPAAVRLQPPGEDSEQRRLANAVRSDEPDGVASGDGEVDRVEHEKGAAAQGDAASAQRGGTCHVIESGGGSTAWRRQIPCAGRQVDSPHGSAR